MRLKFGIKVKSYKKQSGKVKPKGQQSKGANPAAKGSGQQKGSLKSSGDDTPPRIKSKDTVAKRSSGLQSIRPSDLVANARANRSTGKASLGGIGGAELERAILLSGSSGLNAARIILSSEDSSVGMNLSRFIRVAVG